MIKDESFFDKDIKIQENVSNIIKIIVNLYIIKNI